MVRRAPAQQGPEPMMSIGALSGRTGIHIETIRYYERAGVLPKAQRGANGAGFTARRKQAG